MNCQTVFFRIVLCAAFALGCGGGAKKEVTPPAPDKDQDSKEEAEAKKEALQIEAITDALNEFGPAVHTCWSRAAADDYNVQGNITLGVTMLGAGLSEVTVLQDDVKDAVLSSCLLQLWQEYQWADVFAPGDAVQLPPFEFVAPDAQYMVSQAHVPIRDFDSGDVKVQAVLTPANTGNDHGILRLWRIAPGAEVPRHMVEGTEILYVFSGAGSFFGEGPERNLATGDAILVHHNDAYSIEQKGEPALELIVLNIPHGGPLGTLAFMTSGEALGGVGRRKRDNHRSAANVEILPIHSGKASVQIYFDSLSTKDSAVYFGVLQAQAGTELPLHRHSGSSEFLFVLEGEAEMYVNGRTLSVRAGDAISVPPGTEHGAKVSGSDSFKALQFYTPAGPEQRYKNGSK